MNSVFKNALVWVLLGSALIFIFNNVENSSSSKREMISYSQFKQEVLSDRIAKVVYKGDQMTIFGERLDGTRFETRHPIYKRDESVDNAIEEHGVITVFESVEQPSIWSQLLVGAFPILLLLGIFFFFMRQMQGGMSGRGGPMAFGKSKAKLMEGGKVTTTFEDVAGCEEAKQDVQELVDFLRDPTKFQKLGGKIPRGVLMVGPPGTGKTLLARAIAGEAKVPFFSISGSDFVEMFVGVGASRVRDMFEQAQKNSPCIVFIDEIDAVGRRRGSGMGGGHDEREQTLNQILVEMDGFEQGTNVIVIAATNRQDVLDPALLRPGRFDRRVNVILPDRKDRAAILSIHLKDKPTSKDIDIDALAAKTAGSSGADLANIANEAAIITARRNKKSIGNSELTEAFEKVAIGPERKSKVMNEKEKEITAIHESGHALVGHVLPLSDPIHKVTIIPRGGTGGVTWAIPPEDKSYHSINEYKDVLARILGGRMAEKVIYGDDNVTTGAGNDLQKATELAREMVIEQGMGKTLRHQVFNTDQSSGLMFDRMVHDRPYSEETARQIDDEVETLILEAAKRAESVIKTNKSYLRKLADKLLVVETVDEKEVKTVFKGSKLPKAAEL